MNLRSQTPSVAYQTWIYPLTEFIWQGSQRQDYRLWASWSPYDGPKSFLLGRAESISLQRTWSPCTVNGPSSSHCKGPEVHPTLMDLGPSCWEGLSPPHIDGPKRAMHSQGSIPLQRTEFISTQWTWWFILHQRTQVHRSTRDLIWLF